MPEGPGLDTLSGFPFAVAHSRGAQEVARRVAERSERAHAFLSDALDFRPRFSLLVLAADDWEAHSEFPIVGMPHTANADTLVVGVDMGGFADALVGVIENDLGADATSQLERAYGRRADGAIDTGPFAALAAVHELGHLYHEQPPFAFPRLWLTELFSNVCLQAYVSAVEPEQRPALETLPSLLAQTRAGRWEHRSLADFEQLYANMPPENYGWYQARLIMAAKGIYSAGGSGALRRLYDTFRLEQAAELSDGDLARLLRERVGPAAAGVVEGWG